MKERLETIRSLTAEALEHVGMLAQTVHPRVLDDLGLVVALRGFARRVRESSAVEVDVYADIDAAHIPDTSAAMLSRVAEEAVNIAVSQGWSERICIRLTETESAVRMLLAEKLADGHARLPGGHAGGEAEDARADAETRAPDDDFPFL